MLQFLQSDFWITKPCIPADRNFCVLSIGQSQGRKLCVWQLVWCMKDSFKGLYRRSKCFSWSLLWRWCCNGCAGVGVQLAGVVEVPSIFLRVCMRQYSILMGPARGLMFLNWLKTVWPWDVLNLKRNMRDWLKGIGGNQCRVPSHVYARWSLQWLSWSSLLGGTFSSPYWWNVFGGSCSKERPAPGLPGIAVDRALAVGGFW